MKTVDGTGISAPTSTEEAYKDLLMRVGPGNSETEPTALLVRPNKLLKVRIVSEETNAVAGQFEVTARCALESGVCIPLPGQISRKQVATGDCEVELPSFRGTACVLAANLKCSAACVNDAYGNDRTRKNKNQRKHKLNAKLMSIFDRAGFPHVFLKTTKPIAKGQVVLIDYGDGFWSDDQVEVSQNDLCGFAKRLFHSLRGLENHPVVLDPF